MASCPLGFGGPSQGKGELSPYHCALCRGLLHKPVAATPCRHVFCSFCMRKFRDCPVCGADIDSTSPDSTLEASIEKLLLGHARLSVKAPRTSAMPPSACPAARDPAAAASGPHPGAASCPATGNSPIPGPLSGSGPAFDLPSLLLQLALQSLTGGNPEAALSRLDMCAEALCSAAEASSPSAPDATFSPVTADGGPAHPNACPSADAGTSAGAAGGDDGADGAGPTNQALGDGPSGAGTGGDDSSSTCADAALRRQLASARTDADTASRLGAVLGCQADCYRRLGDPAAAHLRYTSSLACLAPWRGRSREADSALSVTHNKLGDLMLVAGKLEDAKAHYEQALDIRRRVVVAGAGAAEAKAEAGSKAVEAADGAGTPGGAVADASQPSRMEAGAGRVEAAEPEEPAGAAEAMSRGETEAVSEEIVVQELCDLATSLCKVADVWLCLRDDQASQAQQQREGQERKQEQERGQESGAGEKQERPSHEQQGAGAGEGRTAAEAAGGVPQQPSQQAQHAQRSATGPEGLLAEARRVLLRPELIPYARACGLAPAPEAAGARTAEAPPPPPAQQHATAARSPAETTVPGTGGAAAVDRDARVGTGDRTASTAAEESPPAGSAAVNLSQQLVYRYMRVWGAMEQLMARLGNAGSV